MTALPAPAEPNVLWQPSAERIAAANVTAFQREVEARLGRRFERYDDLWQWSVDDVEAFWLAVWRHFDVQGELPTGPLSAGSLLAGAMPNARWFDGAALNLAAQALRHHLPTPALVWDGDSIGSGEMSWDELRRQVASVAAELRGLGLAAGDRVIAYLPNVPQTVVAFLAVASIGAVWSVCAPEMGPVAVGDRFRQIEPKLLICCDGYRFAGKRFDRREVLRGLVAELPTLEALIWLPLIEPGEGGDAVAPGLRIVSWQDAAGRDVPLQIDAVPFDQPLWIVYSSGTTGLPKAIVHGHGGILLAGLVTAGLQSNVGPGHRALWVVSTGWIVWNMHMLSLLCGATVCLYEGSVTGPTATPDWGFLWRLAARRRVQTFGGGSAYFASCMKAGVEPRDVVDAGTDLSALETVLATGSPLSPECFHWVYGSVKADLWLCPISGGTDIAGGFLAGVPTLPVREGEMQCRALGAAVHAFDEAGRPLIGEVGELVCTRPLPSMPLFLWDDADGSRLRESYFDTYAAADGTPIWRHGDWLRLVPREGATGGIIYGRSDATINRGGIRMGTAELYRAVEAIAEVVDSLVVDLEYMGRPSYMALFVVLQPGRVLDGELEGRIRLCIRGALSARHVPDDVIQVDAVPRNLTGKKLELPIRKLLLGTPIDKVVNRDAMANPECLDWYVAFGEKRAAAAG